MKLCCRSFAVAVMALVAMVLVSCAPKESKPLLEPAQALGTVLAEETVHAAGTKKQVLLLLPKWAANSTVEETFRAALKEQGVTVGVTLLVDVGDPMGHQPIGLKASDFFAALEKGADAGAIVSLAGAPLLTGQDRAQLNPNHPAVLVVATSSLGEVMGITSDRTYLSDLLDAKVIRLAIVGGETEANGKPNAGTNAAEQSFVRHYRILRSRG